MHAGAVLLVSPVEKLAAVFAAAGLENDEIATALIPVNHWAAGQYSVGRRQADLCVRQLSLHLVSIPLNQGGVDNPLLRIIV